uniref:Uncharacterized protein n=1 Tax=Cuerna arida TaxID=1464854 RepID=A0A1B6H3K3_9HEMI
MDTDCELVFPRQEEFTVTDFSAIQEYVTAKGLDHICDEANHMTVFVRRTPQYWRDKILASGKVYNDKYFICPPTGLSLVKNDPLLQQPISAVPELNVPKESGVQQNKTAERDMEIVYGWDPNVHNTACEKQDTNRMVPGPTEEEKRQCLQRIVDIQEKYSGRKGRKKKNKRQQCMRSIADEKVRMGIPLDEIRELQFVGKKRRKKARLMQEMWAKKYASRSN